MRSCANMVSEIPELAVMIHLRDAGLQLIANDHQQQAYAQAYEHKV